MGGTNGLDGFKKKEEDTQVTRKVDSEYDKKSLCRTLKELIHPQPHFEKESLCGLE